MNLLLRCPIKSSGLRLSSILSTAATRSGRFIRHRLRSHRSPLHSNPSALPTQQLSIVHCQLSIKLQNLPPRQSLPLSGEVDEIFDFGRRGSPIPIPHNLKIPRRGASRCARGRFMNRPYIPRMSLRRRQCRRWLSLYEKERLDIAI